jgi:FkbM family methyltransferase
MNPFIHPRFETLYERRPLVLVDVGARGGLRSHWSPAKRHLRSIGFEPDKREYQRLVADTRGNGRLTFFDKALHNRREQIQLRITRDPGLTSIFEPNRGWLDAFPEAERFDVVDVQQVDACPLDDLLAAEHIDDIDFLKVDTQGSERYVIEGAAHALAASGVGVEVEVEFAPLYTGQPLFADVDTTLRGLGYSLFDLRPCYWKRSAGRTLGGPNGQIVWADALYLKNIVELKRNLEPLDPEARKSKILRAMSVSLLYGYWDYAMQIALETEKYFDGGERALIIEGLRRGGSTGRTTWLFPGRKLLSAVFHRLWKLTVPTNDAWSVGGAALGNPLLMAAPTDPGTVDTSPPPTPR